MAKWYSNSLTAKEASKLQKGYARIYNVSYVPFKEGSLALEFRLRGEQGDENLLVLSSRRDIRQLFTRTGALDLTQIENLVVEVYNHNNNLRGISINPNLLPKDSEQN